MEERRAPATLTPTSHRNSQTPSLERFSDAGATKRTLHSVEKGWVAASCGSQGWKTRMGLLHGERGHLDHALLAAVPTVCSI